MSGPGVVSASAKSVDHFGCGEPALILDGGLGHVGQDRIGAAEGHDGELGEEHADFGKHMVGPEQQREQRQRHEPDGSPDGNGG